MRKNHLQILTSVAPSESLSHEITESFIPPRLKNPAYVYLLSLGSNSSRSGMTHALNRFVRFSGFLDNDSVPWEKIDITTLIAYKTFLETQKLKPNAKNTYLAALKGVIKCSWQIGLIDDHEKLVLASLRCSRGSRLQAGRALTPLESGQLIDACLQDGDAKGVRNTAIISIAIGYGLRRSEISAILIKKVNFFDETISVIGKGNKERLVGAPPVVFVRIKKWLDIRGSAGTENPFV